MGSKNPELVARWIEGIFVALRRLWISLEQNLSEPTAEKKPMEKSPEPSNHHNGRTNRLSVDEHVNCMLKQSNRSVYRKFGQEGVYIEMSPADRLAQSREARENSMDELDGIEENQKQFDMEVDWQLLSVFNGLRIFEEKRVRRCFLLISIFVAIVAVLKILISKKFLVGIGLFAERKGRYKMRQGYE